MAEEENIDRLRAAHSCLKTYHQAANTANEDLVKKNNNLVNENALLKGQVASAQQNLAIQKTIVANNIVGSAEKHERDYREIGELKTKISELEAENKELKAQLENR